ncbi:hypothetical protein GUITHDRAFT_148681 [Guillardia theta CCMP2712]|uniref:Uncharacterized protein n=1 Tax=Guillardia theta (strain CCMP2712) TaxID=905079 RepID=L1I7Y7_GUITC|nr:hypothetical protein GUITHDRAFT_148681 [Guillardia theta CCMP2712]EKX32366.1 hypothetical protein GUITHDRAFT_148681 [Guillardia theta CCMP2712]|eukprot:XP_005819346.1 hypothetical protein GUITHDRAFT_148681 [Guillardia theta CCMP2712]
MVGGQSVREGGRWKGGKRREGQLLLLSVCFLSCWVGALAGREQELKVRRAKRGQAMLDRLEDKYKLQEFGAADGAETMRMLLLMFAASSTHLAVNLTAQVHSAIAPRRLPQTSLYSTNFLDDLLNGHQGSRWTSGPLTYDSASLADSMQDLNADIKRRENIWDSLVDQGGEEYADLKVHNIRNEANRKIGEAQAVAQRALRREYANSVAAAVQQAMMRADVEHQEEVAREKAKKREKEAAEAEKKALLLQIVNSAILQKQKKLKLEYSALKKESERKIQQLHRKLRRLKSSSQSHWAIRSQEEAGLTAAKLRVRVKLEREKLAKDASEESRSKAEKVEGKLEGLLDRLGDARAGLAWLSAKLGAARDDASSAHSAEERQDWWERKAEDAGKLARSAEEEKEDALSQMRQERRRAERHLKLEQEANAKEEEEREEEEEAIEARRKAEVRPDLPVAPVWAAREEEAAEDASSQVSRMTSAAEKEREAMKKLADEDAKLQELADQLELAATRAREEEEEAKRMAQQAEEDEKAAEEKELLTIQRMHQLEASGVEDSREMMRLRAELEKAHNETEAARMEGVRTQSAWKFSEQERIKAEAAENDAILSAKEAQKEREEALAKIQAAEEKTKTALEAKDAASKEAAEAAKKEAEEEELANSEKTRISEEEEKLKDAYARAGQLEEKLTASQAAQKAAEDATNKAREGGKECGGGRILSQICYLNRYAQEKAKAEEEAAAEEKKAASANEKAEKEEEEAKSAGQAAAEAKAIMMKEEDEAKAAHEAADSANQKEEEAERKLAAALARAEKEQEDAKSAESLNNQKLKSATEQFVQASQEAARAQERADELEEQLKEAQAMMKAAQARAEMYSASAASNATALAQEKQEAQAWKEELERRAAAAEEATAKAMGKKWCVVEGTCGSSLGDGQFFDTCAPITEKGCSCRNSFMTKGHLVTGCTEERSQGQPWCKVRETGCGQQNADGAWWDFCT